MEERITALEEKLSDLTLAVGILTSVVVQLKEDLKMYPKRDVTPHPLEDWDKEMFENKETSNKYYSPEGR